jgi:UDPglucose--hexose-1-phosphate uridylyltransferase
MASELRKDPVIGRWVIISGDRSRRPNPFRQYAGTVEEDRPCPFCPGSEEMTPRAILVYPGSGAADAGGPEAGAGAPPWGVRVVPNRFPALGIEGDIDKRGEGLYDKMRGIGAHEIVIETPAHGQDPSGYARRQMADVISAYRDRIADLLRDTRFRYVLVFKNHGAAAGATLAHSHSQIIALPIVPVRIEAELAGATQYFDYRGRCIYCDILAQEIADTRRLVAQNGDFVAFAPFASRVPFEVTILPKRHEAFFWSLARPQMEGLAEILQDVLRRVKLALRDPPYNFVIHTAPPAYAAPERYHWQVEVLPKLTEVAGFEQGSGFFINPTPPEEAAQHLRELERVMDVPEGHLLANPAPGTAEP